VITKRKFASALNVLHGIFCLSGKGEQSNDAFYLRADQLAVTVPPFQWIQVFVILLFKSKVLTEACGQGVPGVDRLSTAVYIGKDEFVKLVNGCSGIDADATAD